MSAPDASRPPDSGDDATAPVPARDSRQDAPRFRRRQCPASRPDPCPRTIARASPGADLRARFRRHFRGRCCRVRRSRRRRLAVPGCARSATLAPTAMKTPLLRQAPGHLRSAPDASVPGDVVTAARFRAPSRPDRRRVRSDLDTRPVIPDRVRIRPVASCVCCVFSHACPCLSACRRAMRQGQEAPADAPGMIPERPVRPRDQGRRVSRVYRSYIGRVSRVYRSRIARHAGSTRRQPTPPA